MTSHFALGNKVVVVATAVLALVSFNAHAETNQLQDLTQNPETVRKVKQYLEGDPECYSCRGNNRSSKVEKLELVLTIDEVNPDSDGEYLLNGKVWGNTWHRWSLGIVGTPEQKCTVYGGPHCETDTTPQDENLRNSGLIEKEFSIPLKWNDAEKTWTADFSKMEPVVQKDFAPGAVNALLSLFMPQNPTGPTKVEIDVRKIFEAVKDDLMKM